MLIGGNSGKAFMYSLNSTSPIESFPHLKAFEINIVDDPTTTFTDYVLVIDPLSARTVVATAVTENSFSRSLNNDLYYYFEPVTINNLQAGAQKQVPVQLTCSAVAGVEVSHTLLAHGANPLYSWVTINSSTSELEVTPPEVSSTTMFSVVVQTVVNGDASSPVKRVFYLEVTPRIVTPTEDDNINIVALSIIGAGVVIGGGLSSFSKSSLQAVWSLINQFQLVLLLPLTGAYIPTSIIDYLSGLRFLNANFAFLRLQNIVIIDYLYDFLSFEQTQEYLHDIDIDDGSTLINCLSLALLIFGVVFLHLMVGLLNIIANKEKRKWKKCCFLKFTKKLLETLTFSVYIRIYLEFFHTLILSSVHEISEFEIQNTSRIISLVVAFIVCFGCI